jgi:hypothetical protein
LQRGGLGKPHASPVAQGNFHQKLSGDWGFIDLFWPGRLLAEHKSAGLNICGGCGLAPSIMRTTTMLAAWTAIAPESIRDWY